MSPKSDKPPRKPPKSLNEKLDDALKGTFPASDPPAMTDAARRVGSALRRPKDAGSGKRLDTKRPPPAK